MAAGGDDNTVRVWRVSDGHLMFAITNHTDHVVSVAFSPDGRMLITASHDNTIRFWNSADGKEVIKPMATGDLLAAVNRYSPARLWRVADGAPLRVFSIPDNPIQFVAFSPDGTTFAAGGGVHSLMPDSDIAENRGAIRLWRMSDGGEIRTIQLPRQVNDLAFSPNSAWVASGSSSDYSIRLWYTTNGSPWQTFTGHTAAVTGVGVLPDGNRLVSASADDTLRLWQVTNSAVLWSTPPAGHAGGVSALAFSLQGDVLASGGYDGTAKLWSVSDGMLLRTLTPGQVSSLAFAPSGDVLAIAAESRSIGLWRAEDGTLIRTLTNSTSANAVAFSPDGTTIASGGGEYTDFTIRLWSANSGSLVGSMSEHSNMVRALAFSPDGSCLASASYDTTVRLWRLADQTLLHTLTGHDDWALGVAFSADGRTVISGGEDKTLRIWDATGGTLLQTCDDSVPSYVFYFSVSAVACAPYGRLFAYGRGDGAVVLARNPFAWPVARLRCLAVPPGGPFQFSVIGDAGYGYRLQTSSNFLTWADWTSVVGSNAPTVLPDPSVSNRPHQFYRAVTP